MDAILKERQLTQSQQEELDERESHPEKYEPEFDPDLEFKINKNVADKSKSALYRPLTREECAALLAASNAPYQHPTPPEPKREYPTLSREDCERLVREHFEYKEKERKRKQEQEWDSQKTTESEVKTENTTKPSKSLKGSKRSDTKTRK